LAFTFKVEPAARRAGSFGGERAGPVVGSADRSSDVTFTTELSVRSAARASLNAEWTRNPGRAKIIQRASDAVRDQRNAPMPDLTNKPRTRTRLKTERPRLHKVILVNDDFTPREFVVLILKAEFRMNEDHAYRVMLTAHQRGVCVVAVYAQDIAETKATRATDAARAKGYPLLFTTEPEE
jgi:ATP-dependent Clp protease adaptor protein ClpS